MAPADRKVVCDWLDCTKKPLLVQLPLQIYQQRKQNWQLPEVPFARAF